MSSSTVTRPNRSTNSNNALEPAAGAAGAAATTTAAADGSARSVVPPAVPARSAASGGSAFTAVSTGPSSDLSTSGGNSGGSGARAAAVDSDWTVARMHTQIADVYRSLQLGPTGNAVRSQVFECDAHTDGASVALERSQGQVEQLRASVETLCARLEHVSEARRSAEDQLRSTQQSLTAEIRAREELAVEVEQLKQQLETQAATHHSSSDASSADDRGQSVEAVERDWARRLAGLKQQHDEALKAAKAEVARAKYETDSAVAAKTKAEAAEQRAVAESETLARQMNEISDLLTKFAEEDEGLNQRANAAEMHAEELQERLDAYKASTSQAIRELVKHVAQLKQDIEQLRDDAGTHVEGTYATIQRQFSLIASVSTRVQEQHDLMRLAVAEAGVQEQHATREALSAQIVTLQQQLASAVSSGEQWARSAAEAEERCREQQQLVSQLEGRYRSVNSSQTELQSLVTVFQSQNNELRAQVADLRTQLTTAEFKAKCAVQELTEQAQTEMMEYMRRTRDMWTENFQSTLQKAVEEANAAKDAEIGKLTRQYRQELEELKQTLTTKVKAVTTRLAAQHASARKAMQQEWERRLGEETERREVVLVNAERAFSSEREQVEKECKRRVVLQRFCYVLERFQARQTCVVFYKWALQARAAAILSVATSRLSQHSALMTCGNLFNKWREAVQLRKMGAISASGVVFFPGSRLAHPLAAPAIHRLLAFVGRADHIWYWPAVPHQLREGRRRSIEQLTLPGTLPLQSRTAPVHSLNGARSAESDARRRSKSPGRAKSPQRTAKSPSRAKSPQRGALPSTSRLLVPTAAWLAHESKDNKEAPSFKLRAPAHTAPVAPTKTVIKASTSAGRGAQSTLDCEDSAVGIVVVPLNKVIAMHKFWRVWCRMQRIQLRRGWSALSPTQGNALELVPMEEALMKALDDVFSLKEEVSRLHQDLDVSKAQVTDLQQQLLQAALLSFTAM